MVLMYKNENGGRVGMPKRSCKVLPSNLLDKDRKRSHMLWLLEKTVYIAQRML